MGSAATRSPPQHSERALWDDWLPQRYYDGQGTWRWRRRRGRCPFRGSQCANQVGPRARTNVRFSSRRRRRRSWHSLARAWRSHGSARLTLCFRPPSLLPTIPETRPQPGQLELPCPRDPTIGQVGAPRAGKGGSQLSRLGNDVNSRADLRSPSCEKRRSWSLPAPGFKPACAGCDHTARLRHPHGNLEPVAFCPDLRQSCCCTMPMQYQGNRLPLRFATADDKYTKKFRCFQLGGPSPSSVRPRA